MDFKTLNTKFIVGGDLFPARFGRERIPTYGGCKKENRF